MNVLIVTSEFAPCNGGVATYSQGLAVAAQKAGHMVTLIAPNHNRDCNDLDERFPFRVIRYPGDALAYKDLPKVISAVWRCVSKEKFDKINAINLLAVRALSLLNIVRNLPFVASVLGTELFLPKRSIKSRLFFGIDPYARASQIACISHFTKSLLLKEFPSTDENKTTVTRLGVSEFWFGASENHHLVRKKYGISETTKIVLTVARLERRKGHLQLLEAISLLPDDVRESLTYVIVGPTSDAGYAQEIADAVERFDIHAVLTGSVSDEEVRSFYAAATVFAMPVQPVPGHVEGFGLVYLEAAAQGLPSIAADIGGVPDAVCDGKSGILVPPGDGAALNLALRKILSQPAFRSELGRGAQEWAEHCSWERCMNLTYEKPDTQ